MKCAKSAFIGRLDNLSPTLIGVRISLNYQTDPPPQRTNEVKWAV